mmetsp:Transcript_21737/g.48756  ORF Transcript_21737/g.48756 Transcript_21737/m.48756 type:complete len:217 (-) Transcript_21737:1268-1918(-)
MDCSSACTKRAGRNTGRSSSATTTTITTGKTTVQTQQTATTATTATTTTQQKQRNRSRNPISTSASSFNPPTTGRAKRPSFSGIPSTGFCPDSWTSASGDSTSSITANRSRSLLPRRTTRTTPRSERRTTTTTNTTGSQSIRCCGTRNGPSRPTSIPFPSRGTCISFLSHCIAADCTRPSTTTTLSGAWERNSTATWTPCGSDIRDWCPERRASST